MPGPPSVEVAARHVRTGDDWSATLAVTGYPAEVSAGWLEPLLSYPGRVDVTLHIEPIPVAVAAARLRRQRARLESGRRAGIDRGQLDRPGYRGRRRRRPRPGLPAGPGRGQAVPPRPVPDRPRRLRGRPGRRDPGGAGAGRVAAAGHRPGDLPLAAGLGHDPAGRDRPAAAAPHHGHRRARRVASRSPPRTCPATPPRRTRCPASCTGSTPPGRGWWPGTGGRPTTTTPSPSPPPAPASPTWPSWRSSAACTRAPSAG